MRISIDPEVLKKKGLSLDGFLLLLSEYYNINLQDTISSLVSAGLAEKSHYNSSLLVLSDNNRNLVAQVLIESDEKVTNCLINFESLALKLQELYPQGLKPGTTYSWRGDTAEIAFKLRVLVARHNFLFTEEEAILAVKEYLNSYSNNTKYLQLLKYFILRTTKDGEINSLFMTIIENNRKDENNP